MGCSRCGGAPKPRPTVPQPGRPGTNPAPVAQRNDSSRIRDAINGARYGNGRPAGK